jgi:glycerophosphoryl diester phosphodiesterase
MTAVWAHRGASAAERENTLAAFSAAVRMGADGVELDVRLAPDGRVVVLHDPVPGELPAFVPTLSEALDACGDLLVNVEMKEPIGARVLPLVAGHRVLVSSFDLAAVDALAGRVPTAWLVLGVGPGMVEACRAHGHLALHPHESAVDERLVEEVHTAGLALNTWTVDDPARFAVLASWGVDAVVTNVPDLIRG